MLFFFAIVVLLSLLLHAILGVRLIGPSGLGDTGRRIAWTAVLLHGVAMPCTFLLLPLSGARWADLLQWGGYVTMGIWSLVFIFVFLRDMGWIAALGVQKVAGQEWIPHDPDRRDALLRVLNFGVLGLSALVGTAAVVRSRRLAEVKRVRVPIADLHPALNGFRIAQISDLHVGPTIRKKQMRDVVEVVNGLGADLVAVTGDLVDGPVDRLSEHVAPLAELAGRHGVWFCTGNHEYYSGVEAWCAHVEQGLGMRVLNDAHETVDHDGAQVVVGGVTDITAPRLHKPHVSSAKRAFDGAPAGDLRLLLAHQPESGYEAADHGVHLQLSGHTHGGQYLPFSWLTRLVKPVVVGLYRHRDLWIYVNPGTTYWGPPMRLGSPQEITLLELERA